MGLMEALLNMPSLEMNGQREYTYNVTHTCMFYPTCSTNRKIELELMHPKYAPKIEMKPKIRMQVP